MVREADGGTIAIFVFLVASLFALLYFITHPSAACGAGAAIVPTADAVDAPVAAAAAAYRVAGTASGTASGGASGAVTATVTATVAAAVAPVAGAGAIDAPVAVAVAVPPAESAAFDFLVSQGLPLV